VAPAIVVQQLDVIKHVSRCLVPCGADPSLDPCALEQPGKALGNGGVTAVAAASHQADQAAVREELLASVLAALVGVNHELTLWLGALSTRSARMLTASTRRRPAANTIEGHSLEQPAFKYLDHFDVGHSGTIRTSRVKLPIQRVGLHPSDMIQFHGQYKPLRSS
jgi:hypothetical protein